MSIPFNMSPKSGEHQYLAFLEYVYNEGKDIVNDRTGEICRTATGGTLHYDCRRNGFPMVTTRKAYYRKAINEMCGYFQGFNNAAQFRQLGTDTWDANGNGTPAWLANRHRKGTDDLGHVYGYVARNWPTFDGQVMDLVKDVLAKVMKHEDDRGLTITFWNPGVFSRAALRPCLRQHTFTIIDGMLHLTSEQRSTDMALGMVFNMMQCAWLLMTVAHLAGLKPGIATHNIINAHIYEKHFEGVSEQLTRSPFAQPKLIIDPSVNDVNQLTTPFALDASSFKVDGYQSHEAIKFPMAV